MKITTQQMEGRVPVTVLEVDGPLDGSNYQRLIAMGQEAYDNGARRVLVDLSRVTFMSSAGLFALNTIARLLQGQPIPDPEEGWAAYHALRHDTEQGKQDCLKLLNPPPAVTRVLRVAGMDDFFEVYTDMAAALASF